MEPPENPATPGEPPRRPRVVRLGRLSWPDALHLQERARDEVLAGADDRCYLLEHEPVVTLGKRGGVVDLPTLTRLNTPVIQTDRGGLATWHGPGQLVCYPIIDTLRARCGVRRLVRALGAVMQGIASDLGLDELIYDDERPGVYLGHKKVGSIGLHLSRGVTMHGFALNVANDLDGFAAIVPCGFSGLQITTIAAELHREVTLEEALQAAERRLPTLFEVG